MKKIIIVIILILFTLCSCSKKGAYTTNPKNENTDDLVVTPVLKPTITSSININTSNEIPTIEEFPEFSLGEFVEKLDKEDSIHYFYENVTEFIALEEYSNKIIDMGYDVIGAWKYVCFLDSNNLSNNQQEKHFHAKNSKNIYIDIIIKNSNCEIVIGTITDTTKYKLAYKIFDKLEDFLPFDNGTLLSEELYDFPFYEFGDVTDDEVKDYVTKLNELGFYQLEYKDKFDSKINLSYEYNFGNKTGCIISVQYKKEDNIMNIAIRSNAAMTLQNWAEDLN